MNQSRRGFTLIELLVVISIIGILSTVMLASLSTARGRGAVGAGLQYEANITHTQTDKAVVWWKFGEGMTGSLYDSSGLGNSGTPVGSMAYVLSDAPQTSKLPSIGVGPGAYLTLADNSTLNFSSRGFTWMAWIKPAILTGTRTIIGKNSTQLYLNAGALAFGVNHASGLIQVTNGPVPSTTQWTHVAGIYGADGYARIYMNGKLVGISATSGSASTPVITTDPFIVGAAANSFSGFIDDVIFINEGLSTAEIEKHFAESKGDHLASSN